MVKISKNKNFRILLVSRFLSNMGSSFYSIAAMWLVYNLGGSTFYTGLALFLTSLPALMQIVLGPIIDRFRAKKLLVSTQIIQSILLLIIPLFYHLDMLTVTFILSVMPFISLLNQFLYPVEMSLLPTVLENEELAQGNSLFAVAYQGSDAIFNAFAGVLVVSVGAISVFYINSATFILSALILLNLRLPDIVDESKESLSLKAMVKMYKVDLKAGLHVLKKPLFTRMLTGIIFVNLAGISFFAVLPAFSEMHGGAQYYGFFMGASAGGMIIGAYLVSVFKLQKVKMGLLYPTLIFMCGFSWMLVGLVPNVWLASVLLTVGWIPAGMINVLSQVMIQSVTPSHLLGRVMAAVLGLSAGIAPIGALLGGIVGSLIGSSKLMLFSGVIVIGVSIYWLLNRYTRSMPTTQEMTPAVIGMIETDEYEGEI